MNELCATNTHFQRDRQNTLLSPVLSVTASKQHVSWRVSKRGWKSAKKKRDKAGISGCPVFTCLPLQNKITAVVWSPKDVLLQQQVVTALGVSAVASGAHFYPHQQGFNSCEVQGESPLNYQPCLLLTQNNHRPSSIAGNSCHSSGGTANHQSGGLVHGTETEADWRCHRKREETKGRVHLKCLQTKALWGSTEFRRGWYLSSPISVLLNSIRELAYCLTIQCIPSFKYIFSPVSLFFSFSWFSFLLHLVQFPFFVFFFYPCCLPLF